MDATMNSDNDKIIRLNAYIMKLIHRFMIVQNRFLQKSAAGLSNSELRIISFIGDSKRCIMREISDHLMIPKNNLTAIMNKLVRKEVVARERTEEDRRLVYVSLTEKGQELYQQIISSYLDLSQGILSPLEPEEQELVLTTLKKITDEF
jgi:DNA-binding MarR family transcriptional regulator